MTSKLTLKVRIFTFMAANYILTQPAWLVLYRRFRSEWSLEQEATTNKWLESDLTEKNLERLPTELIDYVASFIHIPRQEWFYTNSYGEAVRISWVI